MITITRHSYITWAGEFITDIRQYPRIIRIDKQCDGSYMITVATERGTSWPVFVHDSNGDTVNDGHNVWTDFDALTRHLDIMNYNSNIDDILAVL